MTGKLYIVATPIGNLEDITYRAIKLLKEVDLILAEDTRVTSRILNHYEIDIPIMNYFQHSGERKKLEILKRFIEGDDIALLTDAGTPGISDPGNELIDYILSYNSDIEIIPIPGPSAITAALSVCGMNVNKFIFLGFLPKKKRSKLFTWLKEGKIPFAFYESPKRVLKTLDTLEKVFGKYINIFIARELTKIHESLYRGRVVEVRKQLSEGHVKGEMVVVVEL